MPTVLAKTNKSGGYKRCSLRRCNYICKVAEKRQHEKIIRYLQKRFETILWLGIRLEAKFNWEASAGDVKNCQNTTRLSKLVTRLITDVSTSR